MTTQGYIHISEAVKKYDKTRQTFYNYLHKGLIRSKKLNNRTYLNISDIDQLLSDYIETSTVTNEEVVEEIYVDLSTQKQIVEEHIEQQSEYFSGLIETQNASLSQAIQKNQYMTSTLQHSLEDVLQHIQISSLKTRFLIVIASLTIVHLIALYIIELS